MNDVLTIAAQYGPWAFFVVWVAERWGPTMLNALSAERKKRIKREEEERRRRQHLEDEERQRRVRQEERAVQALELLANRLTEFGVVLQSVVRRLDEHERTLHEVRHDVSMFAERLDRLRSVGY